MERIIYKINNPRNAGTESEPVWEAQLFEKSIPYSEDNLAIAQKEAFNGEYTIEDDGQPEPAEISQEERIAELEEALALLLEGATE